jgi:hypothetical protein
MREINKQNTPNSNNQSAVIITTHPIPYIDRMRMQMQREKQKCDINAGAMQKCNAMNALRRDKCMQWSDLVRRSERDGI